MFVKTERKMCAYTQNLCPFNGFVGFLTNNWFTAIFLRVLIYSALFDILHGGHVIYSEYITWPPCNISNKAEYIRTGVFLIARVL